MYSLSISTSGKYISVAIHDDKLISSSSVLSENGTTNLLMKSIDEITKKSRIEKSDISVVYLDIGPGYYTSLRIGLAVAQGVCGIKREEYAFCLYKPVPGGVVRDSEPEVLNAENLKIKLEEDNDKKLVVGDWHSLNENLFGENSYIKFGSPEHVSSENIFNIGKELFKNNDFPNFNEVRLEYMREPDVSFSTKSLEGKVNFHD